MKRFTVFTSMSLLLLVFLAFSANAQQFARESSNDPAVTGLVKTGPVHQLPSLELAPAGNAAPWAPGTPAAKLPTDKAFAFNAFSNTSLLPFGPMYFLLNNPGTPVSIAAQTGQDFIAASSWANGIWYGATYNATTGASLVTLDTATGARTSLGLIGLSITGMAYDWTSNTMYALAYVSSTTRLYTLNLTNGQPTIVALVGSFLGICLGCDQNGMLYTVNTATDNLCSINKTTGAYAVVGPIGFNANYAQDMEFDNSDNTMYYAAYRDSVGGQLRTVNLQTGATTLIGAFNGNMEVTGFAIKNQPFSVLDHDIAITALIAPVSGPNLTNAETVTIALKNMGGNAESNFPLTYQIDAAAPVSEVYVGTLAPGAVATFNFSVPVDLSLPGTNYNVMVYHGLIGDMDHSNDTLNALISNTFGVLCPAGSDTCDEFISRVQLLTLDNQSTCNNATNGYSNYDTLVVGMTYGQTATLTITNGPPVYTGDVCGVWIDWNHNSDFTDDDPVIVSGGVAAFTAVITVPNTALAGQARMRIRITYDTPLSPCGIDLYGEVEDYMLDITGTPLTDDLGVIALLEPVNGPNLPANATVKAKVKNFGVNPQLGFDLTYVINGGTPVTETIAASIAPGATYDYTFTATADLSTAGTYNFQLYTTLAGDQNPANDTLTAQVTCFAVGSLIYDNGPLVNSVGTGAGGADESILQGSLGMTSYGSGHAVSSGYRVADEFVVPGYNTWSITGLAFYAYQTGSGTTSSINNVNFRIWNGLPGTGTLVFGSTTANYLTNTAFSTIYRIQEGASGNTDRPVMKNDCNIPTLTLGPGTYWIDWQTGGTLASGPWAPPITITGQTTTGNAKQYDPATMLWNALNDGGSATPQGLPFKLYGSIIVSNNTLANLPNYINLFPNPATRVLNIHSSHLDLQKVGLYNQIGQQVLEILPDAVKAEINVALLPPGIYFAVIQTTAGISTQKVVVE